MRPGNDHGRSLDDRPWWYPVVGPGDQVPLPCSVVGR